MLSATITANDTAAYHGQIDSYAQFAAISAATFGTGLLVYAFNLRGNEAIALQIAAILLISRGLLRCLWRESLDVNNCNGRYRLVRGWSWDQRSYQGALTDLRLLCLAQIDRDGFVLFSIVLRNKGAAWDDITLNQYADCAQALNTARGWSRRLDLPLHIQGVQICTPT